MSEELEEHQLQNEDTEFKKRHTGYKKLERQVDRSEHR